MFLWVLRLSKVLVIDVELGLGSFLEEITLISELRDDIAHEAVLHE